jgi:hypothetical protein
MKKIIKLILLFFLFTSMSIANIINVPVDIDSIQGGINLSVNGDTVLVQPGTYVENINFNGKNIVVGSLTLITGDTSYISQTVIDGNQNGSVVKIENGEDSTAVLCGFTVTNGIVRDNNDGAGIHIMNSSPVISNILIIYNSVNNGTNNMSGGGGGIFLNNSRTIISDTQISSNSAYGFDIWSYFCWGEGGGILCLNSYLTLTNVKITNNISANGAGISCFNSDIFLTDVIISENSVPVLECGNTSGGGIVLYNSNATLLNVIISENEGGDHRGGGGIKSIDSNIILTNVVIKDNSANRGGGIDWAAAKDSNDYKLLLSNVTIKNNTARVQGGGIICSDLLARIIFDNNNRCNIYNNTAPGIGNDIHAHSDSIISVVVDTFTVLNPDSFHAYPLNKFTFDIQNAAVTNISEIPVSPINYKLYQNYPNPFNPSTTIEFSIPKTEFVTLRIYNLLGQEVAALVSEKLTPGNYKYTWDASGFVSGMYYYRLRTDSGKNQSRKLLLLK